MKLTDAEKKRVQAERDAKEARLRPHAARLSDTHRRITTVHLEGLLDEIDDLKSTVGRQKGELSEWASHTCAGSES